MQIKIFNAIGFGLLFLSILSSCNAQKEKKMKPEIVSQYFFEYTDLIEPNTWIIRNEDTWIRLQQAMFKNQNPPPSIESIDFLKHNFVVIAFGQKSSGGYQYSAKNYVQNGDVLTFNIISPSRDPMEPVTMALTQPVLICKIPLNSAKKVEYNIQTQ